MKKLCALILLLYTITAFSQLPDGFVYLNKVAPTIQQELRYFSTHNFIGKPIDGYIKNTVIVSLPTAKALKKAQEEFKKLGYVLKVFDAYRPQQAVNHFVRWARKLTDTLKKREFYPDVKKSQLFKKGYIASKSGHSRGSTVDVTLIDLKTNKELDMGSNYDFFGEASHINYSKINETQKANRSLLQRVMKKNGFISYQYEWWHFTLRNEPYPNTYFNFKVQ